MASRVAVVISSNGPSNGVVVPLQYAENDGRRMATALSDPACGFNVITPSSNDPEVVRSLIYRTAERCAPDDSFLVYFSGHGAVGAHGLCLMLDETDMKQPLSTGLAGEDLMRAMRASKAGSRILILDCCNARQIVRQAGWKAAEDRVPMAELGFVSDSYDIILASDAFGDGAREFAELESGFLTAKLIEALGPKRKAADTDGDGAISVTDALLWLQHQAREHNRRNPEQSVPIPSRAGVGQSVGYLTRPPQSWPKITVPLPDGSPAIILPLAPLEGRWAFAMGQRPVTNGQYRKSGLRPPEGKCFFEKNWKGDPPFKPWDDPMFEGDNLPIVCVDRRAAKSFCDYLIGCNEKSNSWIYIDLPCPELWDLAAFGDTYPKRISDAWVGVQDAVHSGQAPKACQGAIERTNRFGFEDLIGNVWEWCGAVEDWIDVSDTEWDEPRLSCVPADPSSIRGLRKAVSAFRRMARSPVSISQGSEERRLAGQLRGGSFLDNLVGAQGRLVAPFLSVERLEQGENTSHFDLGFRVAGLVDSYDLESSVRRELPLWPTLQFQSW